ncbi:MAG: hypothetical protein R2939_19190 [Kofleriaceae bacterium]
MPLRERIFRVLEYIIPVATAVEFAHLVRDTCHRDIKPANTSWSSWPIPTCAARRCR